MNDNYSINRSLQIPDKYKLIGKNFVMRVMVYNDYLFFLTFVHNSFFQSIFHLYPVVINIANYNNYLVNFSL